MRRHICNSIAFLLCILVIGPFVYMAADREVPFVRGEGRVVSVTGGDPLPGGAVEVIWENNNRKRDCDGYVFRKIVDSHGVVFTIEGVPVTYTRTSDPLPLVRFFRLPAGAAAGRAKYIATSHFYCNPLHHWWPIVNEVPHLEFTIGEPPPAQRGPQGATGERGPPGTSGERGTQGTTGERGTQGAATCSGGNEGQICREQ